MSSIFANSQHLILISKELNCLSILLVKARKWWFSFLFFSSSQCLIFQNAVQSMSRSLSACKAYPFWIWMFMWLFIPSRQLAWTAHQSINKSEMCLWFQFGVESLAAFSSLPLLDFCPDSDKLLLRSLRLEIKSI